YDASPLFSATTRRNEAVYGFSALVKSCLAMRRSMSTAPSATLGAPSQRATQPFRKSCARAGWAQWYRGTARGRYACEHRNPGPTCFTNLNKCRPFCWRVCCHERRLSYPRPRDVPAGQAAGEGAGSDGHEHAEGSCERYEVLQRAPASPRWGPWRWGRL